MGSLGKDTEDKKKKKKSWVGGKNRHPGITVRLKLESDVKSKKTIYNTSGELNIVEEHMQGSTSCSLSYSRFTSYCTSQT